MRTGMKIVRTWCAQHCCGCARAPIVLVHTGAYEGLAPSDQRGVHIGAEDDAFCPSVHSTDRLI